MSCQGFIEEAGPRSRQSSSDNSSDDDDGRVQVQEEQSLSGHQEMTGQRDTHHNPMGSERNLPANILDSSSPPTTSSSSSSSEESPEVLRVESGPKDRLTESDNGDASAERSSQSSPQSRRSSFADIQEDDVSRYADLRYETSLTYRIKKSHFMGNSKKKWNKQANKRIKNRAMVLMDLTLLPDEHESKKTKLFITIEIQRNKFPDYDHTAIACAKLFDSTVEGPIHEVTKTHRFEDGRSYISFEMDLAVQEMVERVVGKTLRLELKIEMILNLPIQIKSSMVENDFTMISTGQE